MRKTSKTGQPRWLEASIRVPAARAEHAGALLVEAGSAGVITAVHELARGARRRTYETVRAFFPAREPVRARLAVRAALSRAADPELARARVTWRELDSRLWEMDWHEHFRPVRAGRSLVVVPPWSREPHPGRRRIVIHPGMAFGTGQHATTLSCLEDIERLTAPPPPRALDIGTGTGVLAIALAKCGVRQVLALDTDPQAIAAARENLRRNRVGACVRLSARPLEWHAARARGFPRSGSRACRTTAPGTGNGATAAAHRYPLVVANLYVDVLVALEPTLAAVVTPGGRLVASGVLRAQQARLRAAFAPARWRVLAARRRGTWVTTVLERRPTDQERRPAVQRRPEERRPTVQRRPEERRPTVQRRPAGERRG